MSGDRLRSVFLRRLSNLSFHWKQWTSWKARTELASVPLHEVLLMTLGTNLPVCVLCPMCRGRQWSLSGGGAVDKGASSCQDTPGPRPPLSPWTLTTLGLKAVDIWPSVGEDGGPAGQGPVPCNVGHREPCPPPRGGQRALGLCPTGGPWSRPGHSVGLGHQAGSTGLSPGPLPAWWVRRFPSLDPVCGCRHRKHSHRAAHG